MRITTDAEAWAWLVKWRSATKRRKGVIDLHYSGIYVTLTKCTPRGYRWKHKTVVADTLAAAVRKAKSARWE